MSRRRKKTGTTGKRFPASPFRTLKGLAVSGPDKTSDAVAEPQDSSPNATPDEDFSAAMARLGVTPLEDPTPPHAQRPPEHDDLTELSDDRAPDEEQTLFLEALGDMECRFTEQLCEKPNGPSAAPRRMKQLKQGRLKPEATLDLHGVARHEAVSRLEFFLQNARWQGWRTVLVITGKGLHAPDGISVVRCEVEDYLSSPGHPQVLEWSRAPRKYGGAGAMILFLRKK